MEHQESLRILSDMVALTRARIRKGDGALFLVYGYISIIAALLQAAIMQLPEYAQFAPASWFLMIFGWIYQNRWKKKRSADTEPATYIDKLIAQVWYAVMASYFVSLFVLAAKGSVLYFVLLMILAIAIYLTGWILRFTPLKAGAAFAIVCAVITLFVPVAESLLVFALAMLGGYVVPGHLINRAAHG
jgi:hypothetical protein